MWQKMRPSMSLSWVQFLAMSTFAICTSLSLAASGNVNDPSTDDDVSGYLYQSRTGCRTKQSSNAAPNRFIVLTFTAIVGRPWRSSILRPQLRRKGQLPGVFLVLSVELVENKRYVYDSTLWRLVIARIQESYDMQWVTDLSLLLTSPIHAVSSYGVGAESFHALSASMYHYLDTVTATRTGSAYFTLTSYYDSWSVKCADSLFLLSI